MRWHWVGLALGLHLFSLDVAGQPLDAYRDTLSGPQPFILRSFVIPGSESVEFRGAELDSASYTIDYRFGRLWIPMLELEDSAVVTYRAWGLQLQEEFSRVVPYVPATEDTSLLQPANQVVPPPDPSYGLRHSGSITRGVLAGNNRDAIIESGLRLQLSGEVANNVRVQAVLTDESVPIVPEGTTQRLEELDRVFIEIDSPLGQAQLGDIQIRLQESLFGRIGRKVQGASVAASTRNLSFKAAAATSRGIFRSQDLKIIDGVQGPYKLEGAANEPFIFVIPGSESIFLDGRQLVRGETQDYTIDYATGELTFTASRLMQDNHRVNAEFEYRTSEFTRTLVTSDAEVALARRADGSARVSLGATYLREADSRAFDQEFGLTADDRAILEATGDGFAQRSGAVPVPFDPEAIYTHYQRVDTVIAGRPLEIYRAISGRPMGTVYRVHFSRVGTGRGAYVRQGRTSNGIAFEYRGEGRGDFAPVRILPRPVRQEILDLRGSLSPIRNVKLFGEWARSLYDKNRFSALDAEDDTAPAYAGGVEIDEMPVGWGTASASVTRRRISSNFATFGRIKPVEFHRQWHIPVARSTLQAANETITEATASWQPTELSSLEATVGQLDQGGIFKGTRQEYILQVNETTLPQLYVASHSSTTAADSVRRSWLRQRGSLEAPFFRGRLTPSIGYKYDRRHEEIDGQLTPHSRTYWHLSQENNWQWTSGSVGTAFDWRKTDLWDKGQLHEGSNARTLGLTFNLRSARSWTTEGRVGWRIRTYSDYFRTERGLTDEQSLVMQWTGRVRPWKQALQVNWFYETLSERAPVLQEIYIRTGPELGEYVWEDANNNGIVELDELIPETTQDEGLYARTLIPSDSFQSVVGLQARLNVTVDPARMWRNSTATWKKSLSNIVLRTRVDIQEKSRIPRPRDIYLLRLSRFRDEQHSLKGLLSVGQDVWLFRSHPRFGAQASWRMLRSLSALAAGVETRTSDHWQAQVRWKPRTAWGLQFAWSNSHKATGSESFASRRYDIESTELRPELLLSPRSNLTFSLGMVYTSKQAQALGDATVWKVPLESHFSRAGKWNVSGRVEWAAVNIQGGTRSSGLAHYELTDGRGEGQSVLWRLNGWMQLTRILRATITYTGHIPHEAPAVHTMRMQLGAAF